MSIWSVLMRPEEAQWVGRILAEFQPDDISPVLELGSTTRHVRETMRPHIARNIHRPLADRGVVIVTSDLVEDEGVDIAGDIFDANVQDRLRGVHAKCVLICNIFEHVVDVEAFAETCDKLLAPGGVAIVTVPKSYPYHLAPIDTLFRPSPEKIASMFPGYSVVRAEVVESTTYGDDLRAASKGRPVGFTIAKDVIKSTLLRGGLHKSLARVHRIKWLYKPYTVSCVAMRKH